EVEAAAIVSANRVFFIINPLPFLRMGDPCPVPFFYFLRLVITTLCWLITVTKFRGLDCKRLSCVSNKLKTNLKKTQNN
ncbi:hypothetical protein, partial [Vibrio sp. 10N.286.55.E12]|uniref:hypothetical protein n=1 Tax=Vibrio sp. 10N.286.55.E12 TaxID=1884480 RepID=UPI001A7E07A8